MAFVTYKHSFNSGDLITILPGIKKIYQETGKKGRLYQRLDLLVDYGHGDNHPVRSADGKMVCMNEQTFKMMKPLIESQEYIESFLVWKGEKVDVDYDLTRHNSQMPLPGGDIYKWPSLIFPQLESDTSVAWVFSNTDKQYQDKIIINRTERYLNPYIDYYFLKDWTKSLIFAGTKNEHDIFCKKWGIDIPYLQVSDFLELAQAIKSCKLFVGNQSFCWHLAESMKVPRILEVCTTYPNTFPTGNNGYSFVNQGALEYLFNQLIKQDD